MSYSIAASHARGKCAQDKIFGANAAAQKQVLEFGKEKVVNATIGAILDDNESLVCLPTVEKVFRNLPTHEIIAYAPISGLPEYLDAVIRMAFADSRPDAYVNAVATAGGSGVIHHTIANYSEIGDTILTSDWYWGAYSVLAKDALRSLDTYQLFDEQQHFNSKAFEQKVQALLQKQDSLIVIINTPAHNPTGFSLTDNDWDKVLEIAKNSTKDQNKKIILLVDVAYIDYAGDKQECRTFMKKFGNLPKNILVVVGISMSKGFTMYGQRTGAMIGITSDKDVHQEFADINQYTSRATWSNISRGCMKLMATVYNDKKLLAQVEAERAKLYHMIKERAALFTSEAKAANLKMLPYVAGFFLSIPATDPEAICAKLHEDHIFAVPLAKGVRVAVCAVPTFKIKGMAGKIKQAMDFIEK